MVALRDWVEDKARQTRDPDRWEQRMAFRRKAAAAGGKQEIAAELSEGLDHLRNAAGAATEAARETLVPKAQAAVEALAPKVEQAREALTPTVEKALAGLAPVVEAAVEARKAGKKAGRKAGKELEKATRGARKDAKLAVAEGKRRGKNAALALRDDKPRRRWPLVIGALAVGAAIGAAAGLLARRTEEPRWEDYDAPSTDPVGTRVADVPTEPAAEPAPEPAAAEEPAAKPTPKPTPKPPASANGSAKAANNGAAKTARSSSRSNGTTPK